MSLTTTVAETFAIEVVAIHICLKLVLATHTLFNHVNIIKPKHLNDYSLLPYSVW